MNSLMLRDVSVRFGKVQALSSVNVALNAGQAVTLLGPNGAGKSTLIKVLLGLVRPQAGQLEVDGKAVVIDNRFRGELGYLPEAVAFSDNMTGQQVLRFFARARGVPRSRVEDVLQVVGLQHAAKRAVRGYSRGMRQRLGLGAAIVSEPRLLVLDEPTSGLDQEGLSVLWSLLAEWREKGRMVLISTHDLGLMEHRVDQMCVLKAGRLIAEGSPASLREQAAVAVRVDFSLRAGAEQDFAREAQALAESPLEINGDTVSVRIAAGQLMQALDLRDTVPGAVTNVRVIEPGLDVVYERLLEKAS